MKKSILPELKKKTDVDLASLAATLRTQIREIRFSISNSKQRNVKEVETLRRNLARTLTEIRLRRTQ